MKLFFFLGLICPLCLFAKPSRLQVQSGKTTTSTSKSGALHITNSENAILHWEDFSIGKGEKVKFIQPHAKSGVLNRVTGANTSEILGTLKSNGSIFLINPNGVLIGGDALIQTAGFLASTADVSNEQFLRGEELLFSGLGPGSIVNNGKIECPKGDIFLIAKTVKNKGILSANHIGLASAEEVLIRPEENQKVVVRLAVEDGEIENTGTLQALAVELKTSSPYEKAIQQNGTIEVLTTKEENGRVFLVAENGTTVVDGSIKGESATVYLLGKEVTLTEGAEIDVSGPTAGSVLVGGDLQGNNSEILNAQNTFVAPGVKVQADNTASGDGGKVIYWSDGITVVCGETSVRGGPEGGDGGFVEVSGKQSFLYRGKSDRSSPLGNVGTLLLDPEHDIGITTLAPQTLFTTVGSPPNVTLLPTTQPGILNNVPADTLLTELSLGNVTINTFNPAGPGGGNGDLTFAINLSWPANDLTINAGRRIAIDSAVILNCTGSASLNLNANILGAVSGTFDGLNMGANSVISTNTGSVNINAVAGNANAVNFGIVMNSNSSIGTTTGDITLNGVTPGAGNGIMMLPGSEINSANGNISLTGNSSNTYNGVGVRAQGANTVISTTNGSISITGVGGTSGNMNIGVDIRDGALVSSTSGPITIFGTGGNGTSSNSGVLISDGSIQTTGTSSVSITGVGNGTSGQNKGIEIIASGTILTQGAGATGGPLTLHGTGSNSGTNQNNGIHIAGISGISWKDGPISMTGIGNGSGAENDGILINLGASVSSTGQASTTMNGTGSTASAATNSAGIEVANTNSLVTTVNGPILMTGTGGGGAFFNQGIFISDSALVSSTGSGSITMNGTSTGSGPSDSGIEIRGFAVGASVSSNAGPITLTGTAALPNPGIDLNSTADVTSTASSITINANPDLRMTGNANISAQGGNNVTVNTSRDLNLENVSGNNLPVYITFQNGTGTFTIGRDLNLTPGGGTGSEVQIGNHGGLVPSASGSMNLSVGRDVNIIAASRENFALLGHGDPTTPQTLSGTINLINVGRNLNVTGGGAGAGSLGFAQIGHVDATGGGSMIGGDIFATANGNIILAGGSAGPTAHARIGHGGQNIATTFQPSTILLKAGVDLNTTSVAGAGISQIVNSNGPLTLVVDNLFPFYPGEGSGGISLGADSLLSATGELRIYTAFRSENTINAPINGVAFAPGPFDEDTPTEQWRIYFADGTYSGALFKIYYKEPIIIIPPTEVGASSLADILPLLWSHRLNIPIPSYHFEVCEEWNNQRQNCSPTLSPYGSFIFEDDLYWIGQEF
ncbi:MAG: filamentous hemagglutinin N-terminal domain-containing protein [Simkaniaceae bacterium]|nr:MAG: filamentous hemagglutinin N-terminal domain-containing protein [Simkaniaceae bacterium]